jgi:sec-independent protein translocase protein TatB
VFDINFSELVVIAVVALVVIGPERLPKVARTVGILLGRVRRYAADVKADLDREIQLEELRRMQQEVYERVMAADAATRKELLAAEQQVGQALAPAVEAAHTAQNAVSAAVAENAVADAVSAPLAPSATPSAVSPEPTFSTAADSPTKLAATLPASASNHADKQA